ncbi:MAG: alpha-glucuronidase family glycosyl hydrolase [Acidobacteriaceae bacterium]
MRSRDLRLGQLTFLAACVLFQTTVAQDVAASPLLGSGDPAWLSYKPVESAIVFPGGVPDTVVELGNGMLEDSAAKEFAAGWRGMLRREPRIVRVESSDRQHEVVLATPAEINAWRPPAGPTGSLKHDGYKLYVDKNSPVIEGGDDWYDIIVRYCDLLLGHSRFSLSIAGHEVGHWIADATLPGEPLNGCTSTRGSLDHVAIHHGDSVQVPGWPDGPEKAPLDYLSIVPDRVRAGAVMNKVH